MSAVPQSLSDPALYARLKAAHTYQFTYHIKEPWPKPVVQLHIVHFLSPDKKSNEKLKRTTVCKTIPRKGPNAMDPVDKEKCLQLMRMIVPLLPHTLR